MAETKPDTIAELHLLTATNQLDIVPASEFSIQALTDIYNRTRIDYVVPMPMSTAKMQEYIHNYDVSLPHSVVAVDGNEPLGLGMLGIRDKKTWITRLGVIPNGRKGGVGKSMMLALIANSEALKAEAIILEVIKNNIPAQTLFEKLSFKATRELQIIRRPPKPLNMSMSHGLYIDKLGYQEAVSLLPERTDNPSWVTANESLFNAGHLSVLKAEIPSLGRGWLVYQNTVFHLGRIVIETDAQNSLKVAIALLRNLHWHHPVQDTIVENIAADNPHWEAFKALGYLISFSRVEMTRKL